MVTNNANQADDTTAFLRAARSGNLEKVVEYLDTELEINTANSNGLNALHLASKDGHVEIVTELLKRGARVDAATKKGNTALHIASLAGQAEIVNILLKYGSTVNIQSQNGFTPLYMAAQENHDQVVKILLCNGANQSLATEDGFTPLAVAMQQGHDKVVSVLLENDSKGKVRLPALHIAAKKDDCKAADLLLQNDHKPDVTSKSGFTPLHIAAHYGNEEIARLLIKRGADVNYLAKHNISPLHVAAKWGKNNMVKILLENSATIDSKTRDGLTPLHCAARSGHDQVVAALLENSAPISARTKNGLAPLHMASQGDHVDAARVLLYHRAPVDEVTIDYLTSLHVAAHCGHVRVAKLLLDRKADPNARALNGFTPLHIACKKNRIKVVELLIKHGASIESTTESGLTPLHVASFMGCMNIVIFLLQHEANPDVPTVRGETPLHLAARANQTDIIRILLRNGAKVDARAREQQTPLHVASRLGNVDIVMLLLQHGAAVDTTTKDMYTALHIAAKEGQEEVAAILVENHASLKATTKNGFTPLHIAAKYGNINVARILLQKDNALDAGGKNEITALHMACHYDHPGVAGLLLERGASPRVTSQNGHTPLHIAARKNQMEIASNLLEHGADANAESKAGFTPLHLSAQKGHHDMTNLLVEHGAKPNHKAKNGLTALHLCAQEDSVRVASILRKNGADVECCTETGYRPIHIAAHFGNPSMVRFLLKQNAEVDVKTNQDYTPLHQAAQQGHAHVASALLDGNASHKARTNDGLTALNIAQKLGYISVMEVLKGLSYDNLAPCNKNWEEKYKVVAPESLQEASFMSDSDDEGGSDTLISEQPYRYLTADLMKSLRDDSLPIDVTRDDPIHRQVSKEDRQEFVQSNNYCLAENFEMHDSTTFGRLHPRSFLVSFLVDARGATMKGCRHSGIRIIVPPRRATMPIRVTCRLLKATKTTNPPPLMEGEALATRIVEMGPVGATFLGPVLIDVPHFASARGKEREIIILRSENGESWKEHDNAADNDDTLVSTPHGNIIGDNIAAEKSQGFPSPFLDPQMSASYSGRITRVMTTDFPQYFAIITRIKQEVHVIGSEGGILISSVVNHVQAVFPPGALTKKIKVGLQAHVIPYELTAKLLGNCVAVSPVITIEPRRRKFHKPITLTIPVPQAANKGMINQYGGDTPTLRLLCSIAGGTSEAQWEDVTGSTPLTFMNDRVSFTTTVSARFWLMDCRNIGEVPKMATELYRESLFVPFVTNFVIYSKRMDIIEATLRILCMTDGKEGLHTLERQEEFVEIVKSRDVEALDGKDLYIEFSGNLTPVTKSGVQLKFTFKAFRQNRLSFHAKVKDPLLDPVARMLFMREPKVAKGEPSQQPVCILNIVLPEPVGKEQIQGKLDNESDFEDSNIISQKIDSYASKYDTEGKEKSDDPKMVVVSPLTERKSFVGARRRSRGDAANIQESFAQNAACPLEIVDASYPHKIDAGKIDHHGDDSPDVIEKKTYSEKRKFWEEIGRRRDANSMDQSESEVSRGSCPLTGTDTDGELTARSSMISEMEGEVEVEVEGDQGTDQRRTEVEEPPVDVLDISECSVAEKAHYFEEQIQKESTVAAIATSKIIATTSSRVKSINYESEPGDEVAIKTKVSSTVESTAVDQSAPPNHEADHRRQAPDILSISIIDVCNNMLEEEKKRGYAVSGEEDKATLFGTIPGDEESVMPTLVRTETEKSRDGDGSKSEPEEAKFIEAPIPEVSLRKNQQGVGLDSRVGTESRIEEKETAEADAKELASHENLSTDDGSVKFSSSKKEEVGIASDIRAEIDVCRDFLECEIKTARDSTSLQTDETIQPTKVTAIRKEFESRIPKHVGAVKIEKEPVVAKPREATASRIPVTTSESKIPAVVKDQEAKVKTRGDLTANIAKGKDPTESRIPKRISEAAAKLETGDHGIRNQDELVQQLTQSLGPVRGGNADGERASRFGWASGGGVRENEESRGTTESVRTEKKSSSVSVRKSTEERSEFNENAFGASGSTSENNGAGFVSTVKSTVDHRVSAKTEETEVVSSEIITAEGKTVVAVAEREQSNEIKSATKERTLVEESSTQRVEERESDKCELETKSERETSVTLLDDCKVFVAEGKACETVIDSTERVTRKLFEDEHGSTADDEIIKTGGGTVASASVDIRGDLSMAEGEPRSGIFQASYEARCRSDEVNPANEEDDVSAKEFEARNIAETIIQSIQTEIENRSMSADGILGGDVPARRMKRDESEEYRDVSDQQLIESEKLADRIFEGETKRESISITEDLTRDEESSSMISRDREGSLPFETSSARMSHERDMTVSPSTASDHTEMEDFVEGEFNESSDTRKPSVPADRSAEITQDQNREQKIPPIQRKEECAVVLERKKSFDEMVREERGAGPTSGARVLEIIEPDAGGSDDSTGWNPDDRKANQEAKEQLVKLYPDRDITVSPSTASERTDSIDDSVLGENARNVYEMSVECKKPDEYSFEVDSSPLFSPKAKIQSLEIKPVDWMIGDEKIEISEPLQPSQVFNQELEEYESVVKQLRMEGAIGEEVTPPIAQEPSLRSKFTVIPVSDKQLESELVENNLDVSCQELMDTLQKEFDAKTPTDNFLSETVRHGSWTENVAQPEPVHSAQDPDPRRQLTEKEDESPIETDAIATGNENASGDVGEHFDKQRTEVPVNEVERSIGEKDVIRDNIEPIKREVLEISPASTEDEGTPNRQRRFDRQKSHHDAGVNSSGVRAKKEADMGSLDLSSRYAITVLDQVVKKEIAEVKESLEAAKQDLIEELSAENCETVFQIKDSPSEFQFKLQPESIPNELPFLYKAPPVIEPLDRSTASPVAKPRSTCEDQSKLENDENLGLESDKFDDNAEHADEENLTQRSGGTPEKIPKEVSPKTRGMPPANLADDSENPSAMDGHVLTSVPVPVPASRSTSDVENKEDAFLMCPPQPAPRKRHKPARASKKMKSDSENDLGSSSGESNYQSCDYEIGSGSRPSSSDIEAMQSGMPSGTVSEYETALMSMENSSASRPTSQDYHTAISSLSSRESIKSLNSESSGHLASIESSSELSETLVPSEGDVERDNLDESADHILDDEVICGVDASRVTGMFYPLDDGDLSPRESVGAAVSDPEEPGIGSAVPSRMKRSSEMIFQQIEGSSVDEAEPVSKEAEVDGATEELLTAGSKCTDNTTWTIAAEGEAELGRAQVQSVDLTTSRVDEGGVQSVCTQVTSREHSSGRSVEGVAAEAPKCQVITAVHADEYAESDQRPDLTSIQQTSMSTSSTSGMSLETVVDNKEGKQDRRSPDSDSFELVDKPDIIDDFVVIEEVGREAEEFDSEGKSIHINSGGISCAVAKNYDREVENLISSSKEEGRVHSRSLNAQRNSDLFDFDSEESPPQVSNEEQLYTQSYSDEEQYEGGKKWVEMQFQTDARGYEIDYDRGPLEDIKEEEITDFEAGSSRFGSLGSHKESVGSIGSTRGSLGSTPEYDVLAGRRYFTKPSEHDNLSLSSLQEFESLESAVAMENSKKLHCGSQDSINNGSLPRRYVAGRTGHGDDVSLSSLKDFEGLESACHEAHIIELRAREEEDLLDHESPENRYKMESLTRTRTESSAPASFNPSTSGSDDYEKRIREIDEIIRIAQSNVEKFDRQDDTADDISQIEITDNEPRDVNAADNNVVSAGVAQGRTTGTESGVHAPGASHDQVYPGVRDIEEQPKDKNIMETSTDSLELDEYDAGRRCDPLCRSSDSLELKTALDIPSLSSDSLNNARDSREAQPDTLDRLSNACRRLSSDSLESAPFAEHRENNVSCGNRNYGELSDTGNSSERRISENEASGSLQTNISLKNTSSNNGT
ncbi:ankyrin-2-like isoform X2 [Athalia rosae]|uniref:ankyrin-2-like isoform X2 n=1 Tax=Athalia rosae TaxID=37344 RepID=UPI00203331A0|nr:ankyrin-2-like isoform X2 [Athalia rosae]